MGDGDPVAGASRSSAGPAADQLDVGAIVDACTTPPFLVERRVVVVRDAGRLTAADAARMADYLANPLPTTVVVLVAGGGAVPAALSRAGLSPRSGGRRLGGHGPGEVAMDGRPGSQGPVRLDAAALAGLSDHLGEDVGRLAGLLDALAAAYGSGAPITAEQLQPFLGEAGSTPPGTSPTPSTAATWPPPSAPCAAC